MIGAKNPTQNPIIDLRVSNFCCQCFDCFGRFFKELSQLGVHLYLVSKEIMKVWDRIVGRKCSIFAPPSISPSYLLQWQRIYCPDRIGCLLDANQLEARVLISKLVRLIGVTLKVWSIQMKKSVWATKMTPSDKLHEKSNRIFGVFRDRVTFEEPWKTISNLTSGIRIEQIASRVS